MHTKSYKKHLLFSLISTCLFVAPLLAKENPSFNDSQFFESERDVITVVGAAKYEQDLMDVPATVSVLNMDDFATSSKTNLAELLRNIPGVTVYRNRGENPYYRVSLRGLNDNFFSARTLVAIDGVPLYQPHGGGIDVSWLPLANIKRVEVIKGTYSTLYGANAFGGLINIVTRKDNMGSGGIAEPSLEAKMQAGFRKNKDTNSTSPQTNLQIRAGHKSETYSAHLSVEGLNDDGSIANLQSTPHFLPNNSVTGTSYDSGLSREFGKGSWNFGLKNGLAFSGFYTSDKKGILSFDDALQDRILHTALHWEHENENSHKYLIRAHYDRFDQDMKSNNSYLWPTAPDVSQPFYYDSKGATFGGEAQAIFDTKSFGHLVFGTDWRYDESELSGHTSRGTFGYNREHITDIGLYGQGEFAVTNSFSLTTGIRYDNDSKAGDFVSGKLSALYRITKDHRLYAVAGRGFRAPNFNERFVSFLGKTGNPALEAEKTEQFEIGSKNIFLHGRLSFDISGFHTITSDYIDTNAEREYVNVDGVKVTGAETSLNWNITSVWHSFANLTLMDGKYRDTNKELERIPDYKWVVGVDYDDHRAWAGSISLRGVSSRLLGSPGSEQIRDGSYQVVDVSLSRTINYGKTQGAITLFADNLFDQSYVEAWPGTVSAFGGGGEGFTAGLQVAIQY